MRVCVVVISDSVGGVDIELLQADMKNNAENIYNVFCFNNNCISIHIPDDICLMLYINPRFAYTDSSRRNTRYRVNPVTS